MVSFNLSAQNNVFFNDNFIDNSNSWKLVSVDGAGSSISGGYMSMECKSKYMGYRFWKEINVNTKTDFNIEIKVKQIGGSESKTYGLIWGARGWQNSYSFEISSSRWYIIRGFKNKKEFTIKDTTNESIIKPLGQFNVISIQKKGTLLNYYINKKKVYTSIFKPFFGSYTGFLAGQKTKIKADYITIKQPKLEINLVSSSVSKFNKVNMGLSVNSPYSEIAPVIAPDGKTLYIARSGHPKTTGSDKTKYDIWYSTLQTNGKWSTMKNIGSPLNNAGDNVVIAVSPDNNSLLVETLYNSDGSHKSDQGISITYRTGTGWSVPKKVVINNYYNRDIYESFCPTANRKVIIMSCQRDDGLGEKDLWVSFRQPNGTYDTPKNMGPVLNSWNEEGTPYIAPDNKTLYFYSYTEPGYGSADIFVSKRLDDTWTKWSKPKNLGKKINTSEWDVYYTVSAKGDYAFLVSSKNSYGNEDIFSIKLRDEEKPDPVVLIEGKVYDKKTKRPIGTSIVYENALTGKTEGYADSNPRTGEYKIVLPYGVKYQISSKKKNYFAISEEFDLRSISEYKEIKKNLYMVPLEKEKTILLKNVNFLPAKAILASGSYNEIDRLSKIMKENPTMIIELQGHTENTPGYEEKLMALSVKRVKTVKKYLMNKGVAKDRIKEKAFGGTKPIASNETQAGRKQNRRVEFKIIRK